jgi:hypothetical protein
MSEQRPTEGRQSRLQTAAGRHRRATRARPQTAGSHHQPTEPLRRLAAVVLQQPAQLLLAVNIAEQDERLVGSGIVQPLGCLFFGIRKQLICHPLVRPLRQIVIGRIKCSQWRAE